MILQGVHVLMNKKFGPKVWVNLDPQSAPSPVQKHTKR